MHIKDWKKEILTIPNMLSLLRLVLIPVYIYIFLNATEPRHYALAAGILAVSCLTDMIDGKIARKFNMISNLGKLLDPIADKMTQLTLLICLSLRRGSIRVLLALFLIKEFIQLFGMIVNLRKGQALDGALMSGKICTTVLFASLILMVMLPGLSDQATSLITLICMAFLLLAFIDYIRAFFGKNKKVHDLEL